MRALAWAKALLLLLHYLTGESKPGDNASQYDSRDRRNRSKRRLSCGLPFVLAIGMSCASAQSIAAVPEISPEPSFSQEAAKAEYVVESSKIDLDFSLWQSVPENERETIKKSKVEITRSELIRKAVSTKNDFKYEFWTTGLGIEPVRLQSNVRYLQAGVERTADRKTKRQYHLILPVAEFSETGKQVPLETKFVFLNNFQNPVKEDWRARVQYPTKLLTIAIRFPAQKHVSGITLWLLDEKGNKVGSQPLSTSNPPALKQDGDRQIATWQASNVPGQRAVLFEWNWANP